MLKQSEQDQIWKYFQSHRGLGVFDLSFPRLVFLVNQCLPGSRVLNIGVGCVDFGVKVSGNVKLGKGATLRREQSLLPVVTKK